ncbi:MAG: hypothetical protein JNL21_27915 [Myxococcales bacterium]|nr:hypothetical protein [Myxococcales bacterium]
MSLRAAALVFLLLAAPACSRPSVVRSAGGELTRGRFIAPQAYEAYARGALAEAEGHLDAAATAYRYAAEIDASGPEPWTRLGAVLCRQGKHTEASEAFAEADEKYAPLRKARARCLLDQGKATEALAEADAALVFDPADEETALLRADILEKAGDRPRAVRELLGRLVAFGPRERVAARLEPVARAEGDLAALRVARRVLDGGSSPKLGTPSRDALDLALQNGDLAAARRLGTRAGVGPGAVALRAVALGQRALGREQAELVLGADPSNADALVALFAAKAPAAPAPLARPAAPLSPLGRLILAEALLRYVGPETSTLAEALASVDESSQDPLESSLRARVREAAARPDETRP